MCLAIGKTPRLVISLEEEHTSKDEAKAVVAYIKDELKLNVAMITGDNRHSAMKVAEHVGIPADNVKYKAYPNDKKRFVIDFQAHGEKVMFIGDGVNDSPVLA